MHHQSTDVVRDQMEECSGDGAGAMYGTGSAVLEMDVMYSYVLAMH
jgi:hypothetical protein